MLIRRQRGGLGKIILVWALMIVCCHSDECSSPVERGPPGSVTFGTHELRLGTKRVQFDPGRDRELLELRKEVSSALEKRTVAGHSSQAPNKGYWRGLKAIERLSEEAMNCPDLNEKANRITALLETVAAVNNDQRSPLPSKMDGVETLARLVKALHVRVGEGETPAKNLIATSLGEASASISETCHDLSRLDPAPSTFWQRPADVPSSDLYHGFGRSQCIELSDRICTYAGPKESHGLNPGFLVSCDSSKIKLKFAEVSSEPFAARIFSALGFHADCTDFARKVNVRYSRRLLQEFNSRKEMKVEFTTMFALPVYTLELQKRYEPLDYITAAVLRNSAIWSGPELRTRLFRDPQRSHPEEDSANFRTEVEEQIDYLVMVPANVQCATPAVKSIGPWDFGQLDHADRRELRGAGLLAAWLGWFDTRFDNTKLRLVHQATGWELVHYFSDLGGVLGQTSGFLFSRGELPNAFPWTFTRPALWQGPHHLARPLRLHGYKPIAATQAFAAMTIDDARWMARLVAQLSEQQIVQALVASGFDSAEVRLYTDKLLSRRDRMIIDLGLASEIPLLRPKGIDRYFSYDPAVDGPVTLTVPGVGFVKAPTSGLKVTRGKLIAIH